MIQNYVIYTCMYQNIEAWYNIWWPYTYIQCIRIIEYIWSTCTTSAFVSIHFNYCFSFQFLKIKEKTDKITERDFRPNALEQFGHLKDVLQKHGNGDTVWKSFALLLECHNHLNKGKTGGNKVSQWFLKLTCT